MLNFLTGPAYKRTSCVKIRTLLASPSSGQCKHGYPWGPSCNCYSIWHIGCISNVNL